MLSWMIRITASVLTLDLLLITYFVTPYGLVFMPLPIGLFVLGKRLHANKPEIKVEGWHLGKGQDLENPEHPKMVDVVLEDKALDLGFLSMGGPGSGKTIKAIGLLHYLTVHRQGGWVYWEGKGDLDIYQKCVTCGAAPDRFFSSELPWSDSVNVFDGTAESVIDRISRALIASESEYYGNAQRSALRRVVPLLKALGTPVVLRDLYVVLMVQDAALHVLNLARQKGVKADVIESARQFFSIEEKDRKAQIHGLLNRMDVFVTGQIAARLNAYTPTLDLAAAAKEGQKIYLHLPYTQLARDIAIMLTEEIGAIATQRQLYERNRVAWPQIFDDWGAFFYENFGPITSRCRSAKMPVNFLFQSKGQTDKVDGNRIFTTEITDNIGGMCIFRINGQDTADWAARQFGTFETREVSSNTTHQSTNIHTVEKSRVRGDQLQAMDQGEAVINCLVMGPQGRVDKKRYKVRFPLPDFTGYEAVDWPNVDRIPDNAVAEGLHLWRDFMDRDRLADLRQQVVEEAEIAANKAPKKRKLPTHKLQDLEF